MESGLTLQLRITVGTHTVDTDVDGAEFLETDASQLAGRYAYPALANLQHRVREELGAAAYPRYRCHKDVEAFKITGIRFHSGGHCWHLLPDQALGLRPASVTAEWMDKHQPSVGGYFVRYKDGYESYSPAEAFEEGYTAI